MQNLRMFIRVQIIYDEAIRFGFSANGSNGTTYYTHLQGGLEERHDRFMLVIPSDNGNSYSFNHLLPHINFVSVMSGGGKSLWMHYYFHFSGSTEYDVNHSADFDITGSSDNSTTLEGNPFISIP